MVETQIAEVWCQEGAARDYAVIVVALCFMPSSAFLGDHSASAVALFALYPPFVCVVLRMRGCVRASVLLMPGYRSQKKKLKTEL